MRKLEIPIRHASKGFAHNLISVIEKPADMFKLFAGITLFQSH